MRGRGGGRSTYLSHRLASVQVKQSTTDFLQSIYPEYFTRGAMQSRENKLRLKHRIGRETGFDPDTGQPYREPKAETRCPPERGGAHRKGAHRARSQGGVR